MTIRDLRYFPHVSVAIISITGGVIAKVTNLVDSHLYAAAVAVGLEVVQVAVIGFYCVFIYPFFVSPLRHLPQVKGGWPLINQGTALRKIGPGLEARKWLASTPNDGLIRILYHLNQELVVVNSPAALAEILVTNSYNFEKPMFIREFLAAVIGWALLTVEGDEHKVQRRKMLPAFSFRHVKDLYPIFWTKSREVVQALTAQCDSKGFAEIDIDSWTARCTLDIIGLAACGVDFGAIADENSPLAADYRYLQPGPGDIVLMGLGMFLPASIIKKLPVPRLQNAVKASIRVRDECRKMIREKAQKLADKQDAGVDILTVALTANVFTEDVLVDQMMTFLSAGHDTTAASLMWSIYYMAKYPHMQERLRKEIRENLPSANSDAPVTSNDIDKLPYLNAVCSEVLRTNSPVAQTIRVVNSDCTIQDQFVPKDTLLILVPWATNTDPKLWGDDAAEFKPERWLTPEQGGTSVNNAASGGATSNYAFMTFLHGPRSCIGGAFAKSELVCLVAAWIGRFSFELQDKSLLDEKNLHVNPSVVAKPEGGLVMRMRALEGW